MQVLSSIKYTAWLWLLLGITIISVGYKAWQLYQSQLLVLATQVTTQTKQQTALAAQLQQIIENNEQQTLNFNNALQSLTEKLANHQKLNHDVTKLQLQSQLQIIQWHIMVMHDYPLAIKLLTALLHDVNEPVLRQAIFNDINTLKISITTTHEVLVTELAGLQQLLLQLVIAPPSMTVVTPVTAPTSKLDAIIARIKQLVRYQYHANNIQPLLSPENTAVMLANMELLLQHIHWTIVYKQPELYQQLLDSLTVLIKRHFTHANLLQQQVLTKINHLQQVKLLATDLQLTSIQVLAKDNT